jgi:cytochrome P450
MKLDQPETDQGPPAHVPDSLVVDYDVFGDSRFYATGDLHQGLQKLGEEGRGMFWTTKNGGHWFINSYRLLFDAARDTGLFSSEDRAKQPGGMVLIPPMADGHAPRFAPQSLDPPEHSVYRMPLIKAFAPRAVLPMENSIRELAVRLIEDLKPHGRGEFLDAIGEPLPVTVFMKLMGMPLERIGEFRSWMSMISSSEDAQRAAAFEAIDSAMTDLIEARRERRQDDLISRLLDSDIDGAPPTLRDMKSYCLLLFTAGLDTLVNAFTFGMYQLARRPDLQARIQQNLTLAGPLIEEVLRRYGVAMPPRIVTRDAKFAGVEMKAGDRVMLMLPAGNLDPDAFDDPTTFNIDREAVPHLTFNAGPHRCVGSHLARLEMRVFFEEWFARMPAVSPDPDDAPTYRSGLNLTICKLPLVWQ